MTLCSFPSFERTDPELGDRVNAAIMSAVTDGRISETQVDQAAARVAALKHRLSRFRVNLVSNQETASFRLEPANRSVLASLQLQFYRLLAQLLKLGPQGFHFFQNEACLVMNGLAVGISFRFMLLLHGGHDDTDEEV
jgi:hypothetical protein